MADIDLKTETPDTSLPATGFLFGADSQASASPSVYSTQAVATRLLGSTTLSGTTITANAPVLDLAQTWNNAAVTFTSMSLNVTDTASNAASLLMDLQVGGVSRFRFRKTGGIDVITNGYIGDVNGSLGRFSMLSTSPSVVLGGSGTGFFGLANTNIQVPDVILGRRAAANLRLGAADAAAPVAQTLSVQGVVAGTSNTAGASLTIAGSQGTGTGAGGSIVFQVAPAGSSGTAQNALATALTIASNQTATFANNVTASNFIASPGSTASVRARGDSGLFTLGAADDVILTRDAANTLALRNGTNAQTFNVYNTFTASDNFERLRIVAQSGGSVIIGTQKGTAGGTARALELQTDGVTRMTFGAANSLTVSGTVSQVFIDCVTYFSSTTAAASRALAGNGFAVGSAYSYLFSSTTAANGTADLGFARAAANIVKVTNGSTGGGAVEMQEMTAPAAPAADGVRIYAVDNGSGKTQLMALFATGAAQQIAIEP